MRASRLLRQWKGIALTAVGVAATLWLGATGRLGLYIHPRYFVFSLVLAVVGAVFVIAALALRPRDDHGCADCGDCEDCAAAGVRERARPARRRWGTAASAALVAGSAVALLVVPPASLTTATAEARAMNTGGVTPLGPTDPVPAGGDYASFDVKDWASLLQQAPDPAFFADKSAQVVGFISPDPEAPESRFYVARFLVTCCAVDAQPLGVPVLLENWQDEFEANQWVEVEGGFVANPSAAGREPVVLSPRSVVPVEEPADPYVH